MSSKVNISVEAILKEYGAWSDELTNTIADELLSVTRSNAQSAFDDKTGNLRKSIKKRQSKFNKENKVVGAFAPHAHLVERGHRLMMKDGRIIGHVPPHPFFEPAVEAVKSRLAEIINSVGAPTVVVKK